MSIRSIWGFIGANSDGHWLIGWTGKGKGDKVKKGKGKGDKGKGDKGKKDGKSKNKSADRNAGAKTDKNEKCCWCGRKGHLANARDGPIF